MFVCESVEKCAFNCLCDCMCVRLHLLPLPLISLPLQFENVAKTQMTMAIEQSRTMMRAVQQEVWQQKSSDGGLLSLCNVFFVGMLLAAIPMCESVCVRLVDADINMCQQ